MSRGRRGRGKGKGKSKPTTRGSKATSKTAKPENPTGPSTIQNLLTSLLTQSFTGSPPPTLDKAVASMLPYAKKILSESKTVELTEFSIAFVLALQMECGLDADNARKTVAVFFTFLVDELRYHWRDYDVLEEEVHRDFLVGEGVPEVMTSEEYELWRNVFDDLTH